MMIVMIYVEMLLVVGDMTIAVLVIVCPQARVYLTGRKSHK